MEADPSQPAPSTSSGEARPDYDRELGVVEAITIVTRSCPSGVVVRVAEQALEAIKQGGPGVMKQQAYLVLTALKGWRGERARQVHRSLNGYLGGSLGGSPGRQVGRQAGGQARSEGEGSREDPAAG